MDVKIKNKKNNKAQVTIFIIIAVLIVSVVILFFMLRTDIKSKIIGTEEINPKSFLQTCLEPSTKEAVRETSLNGGSIEPKLYKKFKFTQEGEYRNIAYLCYNENYYQPCINQQPLLINHIEDEIKESISNDVDNCFLELEKKYENQKYIVEVIKKEFEVELAPSKIIIEIKNELKLTKNQETQTPKNFQVIIPNRIYELTSLAEEIVNQEARFCNFDYGGYIYLYPNYDIDKLKTSDSNIIYTLEYKKTNEKFRFVVRGCVIPII